MNKIRLKKRITIEKGSKKVVFCNANGCIFTFRHGFLLNYFLEEIVFEVKNRFISNGYKLSFLDKPFCNL
jgi:hypothetical protein